MYVNYYELREEPFGITPDPRFLFLSASHREALAALVYGVSQRKGFISIIGEVGTGKTIVLRSFLDRVDRSKTTAICLLNPLATFEQIVDEILPPDFVGSSPDQFRTIQEWLIEEYRQDRNVVVAIDEAQRMPPTTLERLRLLSNLETAEHKLIQFILIGQPELERNLRKQNLRQLWQRIAVRATIWPLNQSESIAYINHRLSKVQSQSSKPVFTNMATRYLAQRARGNPRRLNILCDQTLIAGYSYQKRPVTWPIVWRTLSGNGQIPIWRQAVRKGTVTTMSLAIAVAVAGYFVTTNKSPPTVTSAHAASETSDMNEPIRSPVMRSSVVGNPFQDQNPVKAGNKQSPSKPHSNYSEIRNEASGKSLSKQSSASPPAIEVTITKNTGSTNAQTQAKMVLQSSNNLEKVVVTKGDGIWQLCRNVYGRVDSEIVRRVVAVNPHILDPNELTVGAEVMFPSQSMIRYD